MTSSRLPLSPVEIKLQLKQLPPPWRIRGGKLIAKWQTKDFADVQKLVRAVCRIADSHNHHPEVMFGWNTCKVIFRTHRPPGLSNNDFICAKKLSQAAARIDK